MYKDIFSEEPDSSKVSKNYVKARIIDKFGETKWTECQGHLYSKYLQFAKPFDGAIFTIQNLQEKGFSINIVSHKTKFPYVGEKINLIDKSKEWIAHNLVDGKKQSILSEKQIIFTQSIEEKISAILDLKASVFIDDLEHVLNHLPDKIQKIWFNSESERESESLITCRDWTEIRNKIWLMNLT